MATPIDCCYAAGGRVRITANGNVWSARAAVTIIPINFERKAESNQDGTLFTTTKAMPYSAKFSLSDKCSFNIEEVMACPLDITVELVDVRRRYLLSKSVVVGRPELNSETGEISGIEVVTNTLNQENF